MKSRGKTRVTSPLASAEAQSRGTQCQSGALSVPYRWVTRGSSVETLTRAKGQREAALLRSGHAM